MRLGDLLIPTWRTSNRPLTAASLPGGSALLGRLNVGLFDQFGYDVASEIFLLPPYSRVHGPAGAHASGRLLRVLDPLGPSMIRGQGHLDKLWRRS